ncbi:MAG: GAF domain-containing protein [Chloroflexi bacterium]|nr:GAF domain-containing protein [Chloroflexota bacterium]
MKFSEAVAEVDSAIMEACARFVTQIRPVLALESLAVVLLDPERDTSRVVFSWGSPHQSGTRKGASVSASPRASVVAQPSSRLSLNGCQGPVGAVLIRNEMPNGHPFDVQELLQAPASQLALMLENIQLQQRLERRKAETLALERIAKIASSDATPGRIYRQFAGEIKQLMDYHRLSFYLADVDADLLTCVYRQGLGVRRHQPFEPHRLSGSACELAIAEGQSYIVDDDHYSGDMACAELAGAQRLRSALVAPIDFEGKVIGAIMPQNKRPNAYTPLEQRLLEQAARLLGPRIANTELYDRLAVKVQELSLARVLPDLIASLEESPDALRRLGDALGKVADFDLLVIRLKCGDQRWIVRSILMCRPTANPDRALSQFLETLPGNQQWISKQPGEARSVLVPDLQAASGESFQEELLGFGFKSCLHVSLRSRSESFGVLSLYSRQPSGFDVSTRRTLEGLASHMAPVVQHAHLYREAQEQARRNQALSSIAQELAATTDIWAALNSACETMAGLLDASYLDVLVQEDGQITQKAGWRREQAGEGDWGEMVLSLERETGPLGRMVVGRSPERGRFSASEVQLAETFAGQVAAALEQFRYNSLQPKDSIGWESLGDLAHALRSPLAAIKGYCSALLQSDVTWPPELQREFLETIDEETDVLNVVIGELLAPTDGDAGVVRLDRVESTAQFLFDQAGRMMAEKSQSVPVEFRCPSDAPPLLVDSARIVQVISDLARCAGQTAGSGARVTVECSCQETQPEIVIGTGDMEVDGGADSNITGADKTDLAASPELRLPGLRLEEDLRVTICQSLLEAHGIRLEIGPWKGRPGLFRFLLPLAPARDPGVLAGA